MPACRWSRPAPGALPETLGDAAVLVDPTDVDGLADALDRVVHDDELRRELVARGCRRGRAVQLAAHRTQVRGPVPVAGMRAAVTGSSGFVGSHLVPYLRSHGDDVVTIDRTGTPPVDVTDAAEVREVLRGDAAGGRVPPGRLEPRRPVVGRARSRLPDQRRGRAQRAARVHRRGRRTCAGRGQRRRVRRRRPRGPPADRGVPDPARHSVRRQQGRRRRPCVAGVPRGRVGNVARARVQPHRSRTERVDARPRPRAAHRGRRTRRGLQGQGRVASTSSATSATYATWCAPIDFSSSSGRRARRTTSAPVAV